MDHPVTAYSRRYSVTRPLEAPPVAAEALGKDDLHLHVARGENEYRIAHRLAHDAYVDAGYCDPAQDGRLTHYQEFDALPCSRVFLVRQGATWVGTVSLTHESERGLPIDEMFLDDIRAIQDEGRKVGVIWRLATLPQYRYSMQVVHSLFIACMHWTFGLGLNTMVLMTHARHLRFYERCFAMRLVRRVEGVSKFSRIPVSLIRCDCEKVPERWRQKAH